MEQTPFALTLAQKGMLASLLDETALFLHRVVADLSSEKQPMLDRLHRSDDAMMGRKVLVVDDDVRNIFALNSVLERRGMVVLPAQHQQLSGQSHRLRSSQERHAAARRILAYRLRPARHRCQGAATHWINAALDRP